jgi:hypothetical protein
MSWITLLEHPQEVLGLYGEAPDLSSFALEQVVLENGRCLIEGELSALPTPIPERWRIRGYTRARIRIEADHILSAEVQGVPDFSMHPGAVLKGHKVELNVVPTGNFHQNGDGEPREIRRITAENGPCIFQIDCLQLHVEVSGC